MIRAVQPVLDLFRPFAARLVRLYLSTLLPGAPSYLHLEGAKMLAFLEAPNKQP